MNLSIPILSERLPGHGYHYHANTDRVGGDLQKLDEAGMKYRVECNQWMSVGQGPMFQYTIVHIKTGSVPQIEKAIGVKVQRHYLSRTH